MKISIICLPIFLILILSSCTEKVVKPDSGAQAVSTEAEDNGSSKLALVHSDYSCDKASATKFDQKKYEKLEVWEQNLVDAKYRMCKTPDDSDDQYVLVVNPAATSENTKIFYGTIKKAELEKARKICATGGQIAGAGISLSSMIGATAPVAGEIGNAVYKYSDVSCDAISKNLKDGNLMLLLGPTPIVAHAVANKIFKDTVKLIPLVSTADKNNISNFVKTTTTPPSVTVGKKNIEVEAAGIKASISKPKVKCCKL